MRFESFSQILEYYAEIQPGAPALRFGGSTWTFSELLADVKLRAEDLKATGKTCMAVLCDGSAECVIEIFAANDAGLQVAMLDAGLSDELLALLVRYTDADALWTSDEDLEELLTPCLGNGVSDGSDRMLFFTSGTTQSSKAVVLTGKSLCSSAWNGSQMLPLKSGDCLLCMLPLAHVFGFVCGLLWGLSCGACTALGQGARYYLSDFAIYRPTAVSVVPALLAYILKMNAINAELRTLLIGAGDCPPALIDASRAKGLSVSFGYGLTETSSGVAISTGGDLYAMDVCPDDRIEIAADGEILIDAPTCMMQGYYKDPDTTRDAFEGSLLKSGDLGFLDEQGRLHITGRKKDMLVLSDGTKIFLPEYEAELAKALPEGEFAVELKDGRPVLIWCGAASKDELKKQMRPAMEKLPRGQQITDIITMAGPLPRTATGKIKRWELRQKAGLE